jgi:WD40 repeat protein
LASCGNDTAVRIWNAADGAPNRELDGHATKVFSVAFHPDGKSLVTGDLKGIVRQWDLESGKLVRQLDASLLYQLDKIQECGGARQLAFDKEGKHLLVSGQKTPTGGFATGLPAVLLFDWASGKQLQEMQAGGKEDGFVYDACFHPAGFVMAASCAFPGKGHLWFWKPGEDKAFYFGGEWPNGRSLSLHPDGRLALLVSLSANMNGRGGDGPYLDGTSKIQILEFASGVA